MKKSRPGRSSDFFKVLRSSRSLDVAYSDQKECKTILLKLQLRVQFRTRTGFPFQSIIHERMMNHLWRGQRKSVFSDRTRINEKKRHPTLSFRSIPYCSSVWKKVQSVVIQGSQDLKSPALHPMFSALRPMCRCFLPGLRWSFHSHQFFSVRILP